MTTDLERLRDHARERTNWQPGHPRVACQEQTVFGTPKPADHANCGGHRCGCSCHAPSDRERDLWRQIADEVDAHLDRPRALCEPDGEAPARCTGELGCVAADHMLCCPTLTPDDTDCDTDREHQGVGSTGEDA